MPAKQHLIDLFRATKGMERFVAVHCSALCVPNDLSYPFDRLFACQNGGDFIELERDHPTHPQGHVTFILTPIIIGNERWVCVTSGGHVIVPPFPWCPVFDDWSDMLDRAVI